MSRRMYFGSTEISKEPLLYSIYIVYSNMRVTTSPDRMSVQSRLYVLYTTKDDVS